MYLIGQKSQKLAKCLLQPQIMKFSKLFQRVSYFPCCHTFLHFFLPKNHNFSNEKDGASLSSRTVFRLFTADGSARLARLRPDCADTAKAHISLSRTLDLTGPPVKSVQKVFSLLKYNIFFTKARKT